MIFNLAKAYFHSHIRANYGNFPPPTYIVKFPVFAVIYCLTGASLTASWLDDIGYTRLQSLASSELPTTLSQGYSQVEAMDAYSNFTPATSNSLFTGKTFTFKSGTSGTSDHATHVATNFYSTSSMLPGAAPVDLYYAGSWLATNYLYYSWYGTDPLTESRGVQNHSWVSSNSSPYNTEINCRLDYAINRDGFVCTVATDNNNTTTLPLLLCHSYHAICVGRDDGGHSAGFTTFDGTGRIKPDIVAPSAAPEYATSWDTPMVAGAAGLLVAKLEASPYNLSGANKPRVTKALLLATAVKDIFPTWANTATRPLDLKYGAGRVNVNHAYLALRAGRATASNTTTYGMRGWAAESAPASGSMTYYLNIPAGAPSTPFCAAITWHRVVSSPSWSSSMAHLNLHLYNASGHTLGSLVTESLSAVDNVQLVYQPTLAPGNYALVVQNASGPTTTYGLAWHSLPAVTVAATVNTALEINGQQGVFTITRTGDTTLPLYVPLTIGGTAIPVTHYQSLPTSVTIPAGQASSTLNVIPVSDNTAEGDRSVTLSAASDFALVSDPTNIATVTIKDKPFDAWRFANFSSLELSNPTISGVTAIPASDGLPNLIKYALGLPPKNPSVTTVSITEISNYLTLTAGKNTSATDITWSAEVTSDLTTWNPAIIITNNSTTFSARDSVSRSGAAKRFIHLKVTRP